MSECEAERRNKMALHAISIQKGDGAWNLCNIERILKGDAEPDICETNND